MRRYRGLCGGANNTGYGVRERDISYTPFQLDISFKNVTDIESSGIYLMITGVPIISPYLGNYSPSKLYFYNYLQHAYNFLLFLYFADLKDLSHSFSTRHTSMGIFNHIDIEGVKYIGYLPQEIIGKSIFEFYHPDDMPYLKEVYETILKPENSIKSQPYRYAHFILQYKRD